MLKLDKTGPTQHIVENIISSLGYTVVLFVILICQFKLHKYGVHCTYQSSDSTKLLYNTNQSIARVFQVRNDSDDYVNETQQRSRPSASRQVDEHLFRSQTNNNNEKQHHQQLASSSTKRSLSSQDYHSYVQASESGRSKSFLQNDQPQAIVKCCACDEAKYELVFEGLWSRYTHPDNFPENYWLAYFSDVIGASHSNEFKMWSENQYASEGVKELAQTGSTKKLESELKQVSSKIRTIIKARELRYPILNSRTFAVFRTDKHHHLVSILSKLGPSPDWMVGVSALELCQSDCSWVTQRVVNLHLWDAGTDSGESFTAPDSPKIPQDTIRPFRRTLNYQQQVSKQNVTSDMLEQQQQAVNSQPLSSPSIERFTTEKSVQYSSSSPTKPFARLIITRQRIYEKACNDHEDTTFYGAGTLATQSGASRPDSDMLSEFPITTQSHADCRFTDWSDWSACSSTCGKGIRTRIRSFINDNAYSGGCSRADLIEKEVCLSECFGNATCITRDWSEWSDCSVSCGQGYRQRSRSLIGPIKKICTSSIELVEREACVGGLGMNCSDDEPQARAVDGCKMTDWSPWSDCSVHCGLYLYLNT